MGCGIKGLVFCRNNGGIMETMDIGQGTHCTKMGADSLAENTPNAPELICPIWLPKPKSSEFQWKKASLGVRSPWYSRWRKRKGKQGASQPASSSQLLEISFLHPIRPNKSRAFTTTRCCRHCWRGVAIVRGAIQVGARAAAAAEYSKERLCNVFPKKLGKPTGSEQRGLQSRAESPSSSSVWKPTVHANSPFYYPFFSDGYSYYYYYRGAAWSN